MAESDELTLDASVAPGWILSSHPQHQGPDRLRGGWAAWLSSRVGPAASGEVGVPALQGPGRHQPQSAQLRGQQPAQRAEECPVEPRQRGAWIVSSKYGELVTEDLDLDVLGCVGPGEQRRPAQHAGEHQIRESEGHGERSCWPGFGLRLQEWLVAKALIRRRDGVLGTHRPGAPPVPAVRRGWLDGLWLGAAG